MPSSVIAIHSCLLICKVSGHFTFKGDYSCHGNAIERLNRVNGKTLVNWNVFKQTENSVVYVIQHARPYGGYKLFVAGFKIGKLWFKMKNVKAFASILLKYVIYSHHTEWQYCNWKWQCNNIAIVLKCLGYVEMFHLKVATYKYGSITLH